MPSTWSDVGIDFIFKSGTYYAKDDIANVKYDEYLIDGSKYLEEYINNGFVPQEPYASRMKDFFLYRDDHCCDRLYDAMIND